MWALARATPPPSGYFLLPPGWKSRVDKEAAGWNADSHLADQGWGLRRPLSKALSGDAGTGGPQSALEPG